MGMTAALCSLFGVLAGKYIWTGYSIPKLSDYWYELYLQEMSSGSFTSGEILSRDDYNKEIQAFEQNFADLYGAKPSEVTLTSYDPIIRVLIDPENEIFTSYDLIWAALAVGAAWKISSG